MMPPFRQLFTVHRSLFTPYPFFPSIFSFVAFSSFAPPPLPVTVVSQSPSFLRSSSESEGVGILFFLSQIFVFLRYACHSSDVCFSVTLKIFGAAGPPLASFP